MMNDKSIWQSFDSNEPVSSDFFENETVGHIIDILAFIRAHHDDVGISTYSLTVTDIAEGVGLPESSVYRYIRNLTIAHLLSPEIKQVRVVQKVELPRPIGGRLPDMFFKDIDGSEILPPFIESDFIFIEKGEATLKTYSLTERGNEFLDNALRSR